MDCPSPLPAPHSREPSTDPTPILFTELYAELHRMARRELARGTATAARFSLGPSTLLHETYLDVRDRPGRASFSDRARFLGYAAQVMRGLIVGHVRRRQAQKRGGSVELTTTNLEGVAGESSDAQELSRIAEALDQLQQVDPALAELVDLKFFCGLSFADIAAARGTSERTVQRHWEKARIYLHGVIGDAHAV